MRSIAVLTVAAAEVASVGVDVAVETEADVVEEIAMMVDLISLQKQLTIVGTTQNPMTDGTTTPTVRLIESRQPNPMTARNAHADVVAAEVADATAMKDNGTTKRSPTVTAMMRGATPMAIATTIADAMTVHAMKQIAQAEAKDLVEVVIVARAAKAMHVMRVLLAPRVTIAVGAEEVTAPKVMSDRNVQDVVAAAAVHADRMIRFRPFRDTAKCRLGTMRSQESFRPTSRATVVDQEAARAVDVDDLVPVEVEVETLALEITPVLTEAEETTLAQVEAAATTLDLVEAEAITLVLTEAATRVPAAEAPAAMGAKVGQVPTCPSLK